MRDTPEDVMRDEAANQPPNNQQAQPTAQPQAGNEGDPARSREIPGTETGEQRWAGADVGAPGLAGGREATTAAANQVDTMTGGATTTGAPGPASPNVEESRQARSAPQPPSDEGYLEEPGDITPSAAYGRDDTVIGAGAPELASSTPEIPSAESYPETPQPGATTSNEAYGQGETREFSALGAEPGIEQQEVLQSQPYAREERRAKQRPTQGILGLVGDMLRGLFGNAPRTPRDDEGEAAGEAHP